MSLDSYKEVRDYAQKCHDECGCKYDGQSYMVHVDAVVQMVYDHYIVFNSLEDVDYTIKAGYLHDCIEDARQTFNDISKVIGIPAARIVLNVTDVPAENRLMRHLLTMGKTVQDHRAIILKMADMYANAKYSRKSGSSMYGKYVEEYEYRKPIFKSALKWYKRLLYEKELDIFWKELDEIHTK